MLWPQMTRLCRGKRSLLNQLMDQRSVVCSAQSAHIHYDTTHTEVYSSQFLYGSYFALMGAGVAVIFLSWLDYHPLFKIWNWIKSVSQGQQAQ